MPTLEPIGHFHFSSETKIEPFCRNHQISNHSDVCLRETDLDPREDVLDHEVHEEVDDPTRASALAAVVVVTNTAETSEIVTENATETLEDPEVL